MAGRTVRVSEEINKTVFGYYCNQLIQYFAFVSLIESSVTNELNELNLGRLPVKLSLCLSLCNYLSFCHSVFLSFSLSYICLSLSDLVSLLFLLALAVIFLSPLMSCYFSLSLIYSFFLSY
jgi:hypothetical protein